MISSARMLSACGVPASTALLVCCLAIPSFPVIFLVPHDNASLMAQIASAPQERHNAQQPSR